MISRLTIATGKAAQRYKQFLASMRKHHGRDYKMIKNTGLLSLAWGQIWRYKLVHRENNLIYNDSEYNIYISNHYDQWAKKHPFESFICELCKYGGPFEPFTTEK